MEQELNWEIETSVKDEIESMFRSNCLQFFGEITKKVHVTKIDENDNAEYFLLVTETKKNGKVSKLMQVYYKSKKSGKISYTQKIIRFPEEFADEISVQLTD